VLPSKRPFAEVSSLQVRISNCFTFLFDLISTHAVPHNPFLLIIHNRAFFTASSLGIRINARQASFCFADLRDRYLYVLELHVPVSMPFESANVTPAVRVVVSIMI